MAVAQLEVIGVSQGAPEDGRLVADYAGSIRSIQDI